MESYQKESLRRIRRNSHTLLQDLFYRGVHGGGTDTPIPAQPGRDAKMIHSVASLIRAKSKLLLLESPDTVEIYKLDEPKTHSTRAGKDLYLPVITTKASSLTSVRGALSQSCPYLYDKRRGSFSSAASQRTGGHTKKQNHLKVQREAKKSNVTVTMTYLGQGHRGNRLGSTPDELKVLQQVNGGENICVFKGSVTPGEQFQFVSQRHRGFPFSVTLYVNSIMVTRVSSCCEYRYSPGFQQGRKSCFRLNWLAGGIPCYRCTSLRNKYSSCQQLNNGTKENLILPLEQSPGTIESCPSSPLFIPAKPVKKLVRRMRKYIREDGGASTDSEGHTVAEIKETSKKKQHKGQTNQKESKDGNNRREEGRDNKDSEGPKRATVTQKCDNQASSARQEQKQKMKTTSDAAALQAWHSQTNKTSTVPDSLQNGEALTKHNGEKLKEEGSNGKNRDGERLKDFYEECVEMSAALEQGPNKHNWFKANILERCRLQKKLSSHPISSGSDVELSAESYTMLQPGEKPEEVEDTASQRAGKEEPVKEQDLQAQLDAMMAVLSTSDEVAQLVLKNTDLTDDHLLTLAGALKSSASEVTLLNLNLNLIGPCGAYILLEILRAKPQVKGLHLFGNKLRDHGVLTLLSGIAELQEQTAKAAAAFQQAMPFPLAQNMLPQLPSGWNSFRVFALLELDIGGNGLSSDGVKVLASYMRHHSYLQYLGLAQTSSADLVAWKELFDSLKGNNSLTQIILDENNLGDPGIRLLADMLKENTSLREVDLDKNGISDLGGNDIIGALLCRMQFPLRHLSLEENNISAGLMSRIQEEVKPK